MTKPRFDHGAALLFAFLVSACVGGSKEITAEERERLQQYVLEKPPADLPRKLSITFGEKAELIGYSVSVKGPVKPGDKVEFTLYWKLHQDLEPGWNLFTHVIDGAGERVLNIDNVGPLREWRETRQIFGPSDWQPGKIYADQQSFTVPSDLKSNKLQVVTGIWKGSDRLPVTKGPHDREDRGQVLTLAVRGAKASSRPVSTRVPLLRARKLPDGAKITIDGKLDDEAWKSAASTGGFVDVRTGRPNRSFPVNARAKLTWDAKALYVAFDVQDQDVVGGFEPKQKDPHLWTKDTVEIMIDPDGDGDNEDYYEIQINPQNLVFDSRFDRYNEPRKEPDGPFGHQQWSSQVDSAVVVNGTLDKPGDKDTGYVVEAKIPWKAFDKAKKAPPSPGEEWRINLYAMQNNGGVAWSPILGQGNFHKASRFGRVLFTTKEWEEKHRPAHVRRRDAKPRGAGAKARKLLRPSVPAVPQQAAPPATPPKPE